MWHVITGFIGENLNIGNLRNLNGCGKCKYRNLIERTQSQIKDQIRKKDIVSQLGKKSGFFIFHFGYEPMRRIP